MVVGVCTEQTAGQSASEYFPFTLVMAPVRVYGRGHMLGAPILRSQGCGQSPSPTCQCYVSDDVFDR